MSLWNKKKTHDAGICYIGKVKLPEAEFEIKKFRLVSYIWRQKGDNSVCVSAALLKAAPTAKTPNPLIHKGCIFYQELEMPSCIYIEGHAE